MNLCVIHYENRPWAWIWVAERQNLIFDKSIEQLRRIRALNDFPVEETINSVDWKE